MYKLTVPWSAARNTRGCGSRRGFN